MSRFPPRILTTALLAVTLLASAGAAQAQLYVRGNFCSTCRTPSPATQIYDDGLHDDLAAGDGVFGAIITSDLPPGEFGYDIGSDDVFQPAGWPHALCCPYPTARLFTSQTGETIHFRYRGGAAPGWSPLIPGGSDHDVPAGSTMQLVTAPTLTSNLCYERVFTPMQLVDGIWECVITVAEPGIHFYAFRAVGGSTEVYFTRAHNYGQAVGWCEDFPYHTTLATGTDVRFQFDSRNGAFRAVELGPTPNERSTWGQIKTRYR